MTLHTGTFISYCTVQFKKTWPALRTVCPNILYDSANKTAGVVFMTLCMDFTKAFFTFTKSYGIRYTR